MCKKKWCQSLLPWKKKTSSRPSPRLDATSIGINFIQKSWVPPVFHLSLVYPSGPRRFWGFFLGGEKERWELEESWVERCLWLCFFLSNSFFGGYVFFFCLIYVGLRQTCRLVFLNLIFWMCVMFFSFGFQVTVKMVVIALFCWEVLLMEEIWISSTYIVYHISCFAGILHTRWCSILSISRLNDAMMEHWTLRSDKDWILRISTGVNGCVPIEAGWE